MDPVAFTGLSELLIHSASRRCHRGDSVAVFCANVQTPPRQPFGQVCSRSQPHHPNSQRPCGHMTGGSTNQQLNL